MGLTIGYGAIGGAIKFKKNKLFRHDGTLEYFKYLDVLLRVPNIDKIVILSKSDWKNLSQYEKNVIDPEGKIYDPYIEIAKHEHPDKEQFFTGEKSGGSKYSSKERAELQFEFITKSLVDHFQSKSEINIDQIILYHAQGYSTRNLNIKKHDKEDRLTLSNLMVCVYSSPIVHFLNTFKTPWYLLIPDIRWGGDNKPIDQINLPKAILSQLNKDIKWKHIEKYEDMNEGKFVVDNKKLVYAELEKVHCVGETLIDPSTEKKHKISIISMQRSKGVPEDYRYNYVMNWIIANDPNNESSIYGLWDDELKEKYSQFKGLKNNDELNDIMNETKYTLIFSTPGDGLVTSKYLEVLKCGVVPFIVKEYDSQYNVFQENDFLRVKTPEELSKKIQKLENDNSLRIELVKRLQQKFFGDRVLNGDFIVEKINEYNKQNDLKLLDYPKQKIVKKKFMMD